MKERFATLDGMRGLAALVVLLYHGIGISPIAVPKGYLSVDLFFVLSGFVLAEIYEPRFAAGMTVSQFVVARVVRLYPFFLIGLVLGFGFRLQQDWQTAILSLAFGLFGLPAPGSGNALLYYINPPSWSLLNEMLINLAFVACFWRSKFWVPGLAILAGGIGLVLANSTFGDLHGGPKFGDAWVGLARVTFSFPLGLLINRFYKTVNLGRFRKAPSWLGAALPLVMLIGFSGIPDLIVVFFVFPILVLFGATLEPKLAKLFIILGGTSYPLYCIHWPILMVIRHFAVKSAHPGLVSTVGMVAIVILAYFADRFVDRTLRMKKAKRKLASSAV